VKEMHGKNAGIDLGSMVNVVIINCRNPISTSSLLLNGINTTLWKNVKADVGCVGGGVKKRLQIHWTATSIKNLL
jgi:hypothetical protein